MQNKIYCEISFKWFLLLSTVCLLVYGESNIEFIINRFLSYNCRKLEFGIYLTLLGFILDSFFQNTASFNSEGSVFICALCFLPQYSALCRIFPKNTTAMSFHNLLKFLTKFLANFWQTQDTNSRKFFNSKIQEILLYVKCR